MGTVIALVLLVFAVLLAVIAWAFRDPPRHYEEDDYE